MVAPLKICFAASEAAPLAKTGGLADVAGALPRELFRQGLDIRLFMPLHAQVDRDALEIRPLDVASEYSIELGLHEFALSTHVARLPESDLPIYLVDCPALFTRPTLYTADDDEGLRFAVFCRAVIETCQRLAWGPDIFHCHDWHTGPIPVLLKSAYAWDALFAASKSILTVHNLGYQGLFPADDLDDLGLADSAHLLDAAELKRGNVGFLAAGLAHADVVTTVSPTYAREIQTADQGMGLEGLLRERGDALVGILNGVDYDEWSPERDHWIPHRFSRTRPAGKGKNKRFLMESTGLDGGVEPPLIGIVSRLARQKGFELCFDLLPDLLQTTELRLAVLGEGEPAYVKFFDGLRRKHPGRVTFHRGHHEELAHLIEAGADMFLMPSRYEPCGLNQMFSLRYGTIPIVRRTGGLADSVEPYDPRTGEGTGFLFGPFESAALREALELALATYRDPAAWSRLMDNAMSRDFSWKKQAGRYRELYAGLGPR